MMPEYANYLFAISLVLAIAGGLGVSYAVFRSSSKTHTIELFSNETDALTQALSRHVDRLNLSREDVGRE